MSDRICVPDYEGDQKLCFVTVGATADFNSLLEAVCNVEFVKCLCLNGYTELRIQYGKGGESTFSQFVSKYQLPSGLALIEKVVVKGFDFQKTLADDMRMAKGGIKGYAEGVIISHAGTGSILEAFRVNAPLILVPNDTLLDNHQEELAEELNRQGYAITGSTRDLTRAVYEVETQRKSRVPYLSVNHKPGRIRFTDILDEEMGFVD